MGIERRLAIVTGGAQGIGKAVVGRLLRDGMSVALASDESSFITGANFFVNGGMTRKMVYV
ncbi:MAG: SDR family NAD(P)-dependent oxidoreductase [Syntrophobacteraceae bacterium]|nr:SDR family NAD(P)-dependent oxidoreductase [Desulfobacteraceae bacterium]